MKKKLHILFVNSWYPSRVMPTNGDFIQRHAEAVATDQQVTAIHIISDKNAQSKIEITDETINGIRTLIGYVRTTQNPILKYYHFIKVFRRMMHQVEAFDLVHLNRIYPLGVFALYLKYVKKRPYIISEHWTGFLKNRPNALSSIEKIISKKIAKKASFICPVSQNLANSMREAGLKGRYKVIPNVVDTTLFKPAQNDQNHFTMLHVSNMIDEHKNIRGLLKVVADLSKEIQHFKLILIGSGSDHYSEEIHHLSLEDHIETISQIEHSEIVTFMQKADVFVLFSNYENLPCVILESFSCGLPVISSNVGGISEFFPKDFGYLIQKNDSRQLLESLRSFHHNKQVYPSEKMHQYVKDHFSPGVISTSFYNCYKSALNS